MYCAGRSSVHFGFGEQRLEAGIRIRPRHAGFERAVQPIPMNRQVGLGREHGQQQTRHSGIGGPDPQIHRRQPFSLERRFQVLDRRPVIHAADHNRRRDVRQADRVLEEPGEPSTGAVGYEQVRAIATPIGKRFGDARRADRPWPDRSAALRRARRDCAAPDWSSNRRCGSTGSHASRRRR